MAFTPVPLNVIENAIREVCCALDEKNEQSFSWTDMQEDELWCELVACILGSRVRFEVAHSAVERMGRRGLFSKLKRSSRFDKYEQDVVEALSEANGTGERRYPFFRMRANQIRHAAEHIYGRCGTIREFLEDSRDFRDARRRLAAEVSGLGPKQASLFLRNIGYAAHIAILDVHVLTYMNWVGLTRAPIRSVPTVKKYEDLEDAFIERAFSFGYAPNRFDLAVWVVVRIIREEDRIWV